ncbi:putative 5'(3')-deoxyribonucleotidase [Paenibacillus curdlanolyticus]|nr:putative 5'(3')-deoxyribonucleotidase [Paenibacillus curdlanolyticus]
MDMDNVIANLTDPWLESYNNTYNDHLKVSDITMWDWHVITKPEAQEKIYKLLTPELFESLPVIEGSQEVLEKLVKDYEVFIATAAGEASIIPAKAKWLKKHFPFINKDKIVYAIDKSICYGDYLIDDKPENLLTFRGKGLLFDAEHNQNEHRFERFKNWNEIANYFGV